MEKFIDKVTYKVDGMEFELDSRLESVLKRTIELARIYPNLHTYLVEDSGKDVVVYAKEEVTEREVSEYVHRREQTIDTFKQVLQKKTREECQEILERYLELKKEYERYEKENRSKDFWNRTYPEGLTIDGIELYIRYNDPTIEIELDGEQYGNRYAEEELMAIFNEVL